MADEELAHRVHKLLNNYVLEPEDLKQHEYVALKEYFPRDAAYVREFLKVRQQMIEEGTWTDAHEPTDREKRLNRYEAGEGMVSPDDLDEA